jgi:hypothetical protein
MDSSGRRVTGDPLASESEAATVRVRDGRTHTSNGAVRRTGDVLLGFEILDCEDRDEAIRLAAEYPLAARGGMEVRAIGEPAQPVSVRTIQVRPSISSRTASR